ncbi:MAG TPA: FHA domain-containing protein [Tepidisphaeraceae bacterium]|jgi:hypothetical protein|nr:FHA domain-containing protein [Tepidisphaeraceae bacterium]
MTDEKLSINWDDLKSRRVDNRLREQGAMERNRAYAKMQEDALPEATAPKGSIFNHAIFCMTLFGLIGGLLAWSAGTLIAGPLTPVIGSMFHYDPGAKADAARRLAEIEATRSSQLIGKIDAKQAQVAIEEQREDGRANPYFRIASDPTLSETKKRVQTHDLETNDNYAAFLVNLLSYGLCGMMIAMCLASAEPITQRKTRSAVVSAATGAAAGLLGGVAAALLIGWIASLRGTSPGGDSLWIRILSSHAVIWGILGLFLGIGPGVVLRNARKLSVGALGGLCGGLIGGALLGPIEKFASGEPLGKLVAFVAIGVVAGLATGLLENVIKGGWLKVTSGIIAGKQFILYRNPTYIGASPDCQIYLFKDPQVGKRHAAIHLQAGGIEIEDLPLGSATLINGKPVKRAKLKNGDTIQIGSTSFRFLQKRPGPGH